MFTKEELRQRMSIFTGVPHWLHGKSVNGSTEDIVVFQGVKVNRYKLHFLIQMKKADEFFHLLKQASPIVLDSLYTVNSFKAATHQHMAVGGNISEEDRQRLRGAATIIDAIPTSSPAYEEWINDTLPPDPNRFKEVI